MASGILQCLAKSRAAPLCQQDQIYDRIYYSVLLWPLWERYATNKQKQAVSSVSHWQMQQKQ